MNNLIYYTLIVHMSKYIPEIDKFPKNRVTGLKGVCTGGPSGSASICQFLLLVRLM